MLAALRAGLAAFPRMCRRGRGSAAKPLVSILCRLSVWDVTQALDQLGLC